MSFQIIIIHFFFQNFKLKNLAKQRNIPIYTLNQVSFYQVTKLVQFISS
jgi:hypothetical protein